MRNHGLTAVVSLHFMLRMSRFATPCSHPHPSSWGTLAVLDSPTALICFTVCGLHNLASFHHQPHWNGTTLHPSEPVEFQEPDTCLGFPENSVAHLASI